MQAKILTALLADRILLEGRFFPLGIRAGMKSAGGTFWWKCVIACGASSHRL